MFGRLQNNELQENPRSNDEVLCNDDVILCKTILYAYCWKPGFNTLKRFLVKFITAVRSIFPIKLLAVAYLETLHHRKAVK